eukprot:scaffold18354_cov48-Attheya_sp.AAC.5
MRKLLNSDWSQTDHGFNKYVSSDGLPSYIRMLQHGLQSNDLDMEKVHLGGNTWIVPRAIIAIASALHKNTHLLELRLSRIHVSAEESAAIALHDTNIGDVGVVAIAKALETNTTLTQLVLDSKNKSIEKLDLGSNIIGYEGVNAIAKVTPEEHDSDIPVFEISSGC